MPAESQTAHGLELERELVAASLRFDLTGVRKLAHRAVAALDPDGIEPRDTLIDAQRGITARTRRDGSVRLIAELSPLDFETVQTVWDVTPHPDPPLNRRG